ncbi:MAG: sigma-70 family RNA polymerase sigma factor [Nannocystaceae bacterium]
MSGVSAARADSEFAAPRPEATTPPLEVVYRRHAGFVWRTVKRLGVPEDAAEDVMHDVFLVVQRRLDDFDGRAAMSTWLFGIARGVAANYRRAAGRLARRLKLIPRPQPQPTPEDEAEAQRAAALVRQFLATLDPEMRLVFELVDIEGMRGSDVSRTLDLPLPRVYSRLRIARSRFQQLLASTHEGDRGDEVEEPSRE